ncbi:hypothetical protein [Actinophytocola sp.]|uniref:hypothetical protein n=1 Tax=Actinophytocola sp. TaxID=1872138 RepID=UPI00345B9042
MLSTPTGPSPGVEVTVAAGTRRSAGMARLAAVTTARATASPTASRAARPLARRASSAENWKKQTRL